MTAEPTLDAEELLARARQVTGLEHFDEPSPIEPLTALRSVAYSRGISIPASPLGKIKMVAQIVAILALILGDVVVPGLLLVGKAALWVAVITALISAFDYFRRFSFFSSSFPGPKVTQIADIREQRERRAARR